MNWYHVGGNEWGSGERECVGNPKKETFDTFSFYLSLSECICETETQKSSSLIHKNIDTYISTYVQANIRVSIYMDTYTDMHTHTYALSHIETSHTHTVQVKVTRSERSASTLLCASGSCLTVPVLPGEGREPGSCIWRGPHHLAQSRLSTGSNFIWRRNGSSQSAGPVRRRRQITGSDSSTDVRMPTGWLAAGPAAITLSYQISL